MDCSDSSQHFAVISTELKAHISSYNANSGDARRTIHSALAAAILQNPPAIEIDGAFEGNRRRNIAVQCKMCSSQSEQQMADFSTRA